MDNTKITELENRIRVLEEIVDSLDTKINNNYFDTNSQFEGCVHTGNNQRDVLEQDRADIDYIAMETGVDL
jgi:hypothetical protein